MTFRTRPILRFIASCALALTLLGCGYKNAMKDGDAAMASQRYEDALGYYQRALALKPDSAEARAKVTQAQEQAVKVRVAAGEAKLASRDLYGAVSDAAAAVAILPESQAVRGLVDAVVAAVIDGVGRLSESGVHAEARALAEAAITGLPAESGRLSEARKAAAERWAAALTAGAGAAEAAGRPADALLQRAMIAELAAITGDGEAVSARDRSLAALKDRSMFRVAQAPSRDATASAVAARLVAADSARWLEVLAPGPIPATATATLAFSLAAPRFATDKRTRSESARYQSGTQQVANPFYKSAQDKVLDQERRVTDAEKEVSKQQAYVEQYRKDVAKEGPSPNTSTGAEQNLYNAENRLEAANRRLLDERNQLQQRRDELQRTPQTKEEPVYTTAQYTVTTHVMTASSRLSGSITPKSGAKIELGSELSTQAQDDAHDGLPAANVAADPLNLPPKSELEGKLVAAAEAELMARVAAAFEAHRQALRAGGGGEDESVEKTALFLLMDARSEDAAADELIWRARGIPGASALLRGAQGK